MTERKVVEVLHAMGVGAEVFYITRAVGNITPFLVWLLTIDSQGFGKIVELASFAREEDARRYLKDLNKEAGNA